MDRQRRLRRGDDDALIVLFERPVVARLDHVGVDRKQRVDVAVAHHRGEVALNLGALVGPAVAALFQRAGGEQAYRRGRRAAQLGHCLRHRLPDRQAVDGEGLITAPQAAAAEQGHTHGESGAGILVERLVDLAGRALEIQVVGGRVADRQRLVDVGHARGLVAVGVGDDEHRVTLAHFADHLAEGGGGHVIFPDGEFGQRQAVEDRQRARTLGHRDLRGGATASVAEVLADEFPGLDR